MSLDINPNLNILESLFFGRGSVPKGFKLNQRDNEIATKLLLTEEGLIKNHKKPHFTVGLGAALLNSKNGLTLDNFETVIEIRRVCQNGVVFKNVDDGIDALPDLFMEPLGRLNDEIDSVGDKTFDFKLVFPKEKKVITLKDLKNSGLPIIDIADKLDLTLEELVERINKNGTSLEDLAHIVS